MYINSNLTISNMTMFSVIYTVLLSVKVLIIWPLDSVSKQPKIWRGVPVSDHSSCYLFKWLVFMLLLEFMCHCSFFSLCLDLADGWWTYSSPFLHRRVFLFSPFPTSTNHEVRFFNKWWSKIWIIANGYQVSWVLTV